MEILYNIISLGIGLLIGYLISYMNKKGENRAIKEDIGAITKIVKGIETDFSKDIEEVKTSLKNQSDMLSIRRQVYTNMVNSIRIFISGSQQTPATKEQFLANYSIIWLWATDEIISELNSFLDLQIKIVAKPGSVSQEELKNSFTECLIAMRKDVGFIDTTVKDGDYRFFNFL